MTPSQMASGHGIQNDPLKDAAFPRWIIMESRWNKNWLSLGSPEISVIWRPIADKNFKLSSSIGPMVSTATGQNI